MLGGGQLARMLALAGAPLGMRFVQLAPPGEHAGEGLVETIQAPFEDERALRELASRSDVITFESENVPVQVVRTLGALARVEPSAEALAAASDRWAEKALFDRLGIPTAAWRRAASDAELEEAIAQVGLPIVLKTRRFGYDGRGQLVCRTPEDAAGAWSRLGGVDLLCEQWVPFDRELSIIVVRGRDGDLRWYPLAQNRHEQGILRASWAPAPDVPDGMAARARDYSDRIVREFGYVGVLALEMFQHGDVLLANEMAPRVHNTGHWTIEGARTSQFENHLRAIAGWPIGDTTPYGSWIMLNLIGSIPPMHELLAIAGTHVHVYGKQPRPGRKLGHISTLVDSPAEAEQRTRELRRLIERGPD
jgi:5-(carboxyamino)imidazole ribonucleotide synthase